MHIIYAPPGELSILLIPGHTEVHIPIHRVCESLVNQTSDHGDDLIHFTRRAGIYSRRENIELAQMVFEFPDVHFAQHKGVHSFFVGAQDDLIIHVREVHDMADFITAELEITPDRVENQRGHGMPNVSLGIDCWSADVHTDLAWLQRNKFLNGAGQCVIDFHFSPVEIF